MNLRLHRLILSASENFSQREIAGYTDLAKSTVGDWQREPLREAGDYLESPSDDGRAVSLRSALSAVQEKQEPSGPSIGYSQNSKGELTFEGTTGGRVITEAELFDMFGLVQDEWTVKELTVTPFTTSMKLKKWDEEREHFVDVPHQQTNYSLRAKLSPNNQVVDKVKSLEALLGRYVEIGPGPKEFIADKAGLESCALVLNIADVHIAKFAYEQSWTINEAVSLHDQAVESILGQAKHYNVDEIVILYGNDLTQSDNLRGQTTSGTQVENSATWYSQFDAAVEIGISTIDAARNAAKKVTLLHVPGNHDFHTSYGVVKVLQAYFTNADDVEVIVSNNGRVAHTFGKNFFLGTHGQTVKFQTAAMTMAIEHPNEWAACPNRFLFTGHLHKKDGGMFISAYQENQGVKVYQAPSLSPTDYWHSTHGFIGSLRAAQGYLFGANSGEKATFNFNVPKEG